MASRIGSQAPERRELPGEIDPAGRPRQGLFVPDRGRSDVPLGLVTLSEALLDRAIPARGIEQRIKMSACMRISAEARRELGGTSAEVVASERAEECLFVQIQGPFPR